jgi:hypothetical protein
LNFCHFFQGTPQGNLRFPQRVSEPPSKVKKMIIINKHQLTCYKQSLRMLVEPVGNWVWDILFLFGERRHWPVQPTRRPIRLLPPSNNYPHYFINPYWQHISKYLGVHDKISGRETRRPRGLARSGLPKGSFTNWDNSIFFF